MKDFLNPNTICARERINILLYLRRLKSVMKLLPHQVWLHHSGYIQTVISLHIYLKLGHGINKWGHAVSIKCYSSRTRARINSFSQSNLFIYPGSKETKILVSLAMSSKLIQFPDEIQWFTVIEYLEEMPLLREIALMENAACVVYRLVSFFITEQESVNTLTFS